MFFMVRQFGVSGECSHVINLVVDGTSGNLYVNTTRQSYHGLKNSGDVWMQRTISSVDKLALIDVLSATVVQTFDISTFTPSGGTCQIKGIDPSNNGAFVRGGGSSTRTWRANPDGTSEHFNATGDFLSRGCVVDSSGNMWGTVAASTNVIRLSSINYSTNTCTETATTGTRAVPDFFLKNADGIAGRIYAIGTGASFPIIYIDTSTLAGTQVIASSAGASALIGLDGNIYSSLNSGSDTIIRKHDQDGTSISSLTITGVNNRYPFLYDNNGFLWVAALTANSYYRIRASDMTLMETLANTTYGQIVAEPFNGVPAVVKVTSFLGLGIIECV